MFATISFFIWRPSVTNKTDALIGYKKAKPHLSFRLRASNPYSRATSISKKQQPVKRRKPFSTMGLGLTVLA